MILNPSLSSLLTHRLLPSGKQNPPSQGEPVSRAPLTHLLIPSFFPSPFPSLLLCLRIRMQPFDSLPPQLHILTTSIVYIFDERVREEGRKLYNWSESEWKHRWMREWIEREGTREIVEEAPGKKGPERRIIYTVWCKYCYCRKKKRRIKKQATGN